ncbi:UTP11 protein, partial [Amia calva]|nr:UTP11 protein [Amia calva]
MLLLLLSYVTLVFQPGFRKHLGFLEKKKDYKLRANDYHKKQNTINALRKRALEKNPDEFYFNMTSTQLQANVIHVSVSLQDGVHVIKQPEEEVTEEQRKLMKTQDLKYVEMKRVAEAKKIERLKGELHLLDAEGKVKNKHTFFVDSRKEAAEFDVAKRLNTVPELLHRVFNRPTVDMLQTETIKGATRPTELKKLAKQRNHQYKILSQRIEREKKLFVISQKIQTHKDLAVSLASYLVDVIVAPVDIKSSEYNLVTNMGAIITMII